MIERVRPALIACAPTCDHWSCVLLRERVAG